ncbi:Myc-type basic helix-loop-helix (bHLH) domain [Arabidopsis thaliana x Arabidopsis arenosa]|uniref:Myc-type basic helix-loop-helix (BHLH) domain n=2 Tax=Arabidopsis TaxID=3701 RepID=A0A8T1ZDC1_ARASU|nr:Myc-type basic helix-loop-helix (bHLH) domain [Arabidopsis thaliana x Arabidopsis arenosa]KAG7557180.1 Myc-type basic helix-loop-helix (bHLH) domain [Arabidopsis suecica]
MQSTSVGSSGGGDDGGAGRGGGGGGGGVSRSGLSRIRSAPATWLEALLEEDEEESLKPNLGLTDLLTGNSNDLPTSRGSFEFPIPVEQGLYQQGGFHRQNSTPADFLSGSDGFIQSFGIPANYDYLSGNIDVSPGSKRSREMEALFSSPEFTSQMKGEQSSGQVPAGVSGMTDMNMENLMEDSVAFRVRAKRGCATHPRSIAERVRRTRISDRIRKLQELVPNMDKQTNTADMLEEAVEYVKVLQRQIQELTEEQKRCTCIPKEEQ